MTKVRFTAPVGRLVQGSVDEPQVKDAQGALRVVKTGPNAGQPNPQYFIGVAYPKADPQGEFGQFYGILATKAAEDFPNLFPQGAGGQCVHPQFAMKVIDGDGLDTNGKSNATKEGFAGHWVVRYASAYPPRCFYAGRYAPQEQIQEKGAIKRGYFVRVSGTAEGNGNAQRPGLYVNLDMVELSAYGPEIISGPDAGEAFGGGPGALPPGASAAPLTPPVATPPAPGQPAAPMVPPAAAPAPLAPPIAAPPVVPGPQRPTDPAHIHAAGTADEQWWVNGAWMKAPVAAPPVAPPAPAAPVAPYTNYMVPPAAAPAPGPGPTLPVGPVPPASAPALPTPALPPAPAAASRTMTAAANGATYEAMIAAGWTDETLRTHGMMI